MKSEYTNPLKTSLSSVGETDASEKNLRMAPAVLPSKPDENVDPLQDIYRDVLIQIGEDPGRDGLLRTPHRVAKALRTLTSGYTADLDEIVNGAVFPSEGYKEMVLVRDVEFYSLCEHHMLPFFGKISVAYLPGDKIIGLSKIPRLVDVFARRLQVQERLTVQVAEALQELLDPRGVAVIANGFHLCMAMRGVEKQGSATTTTAFRGEFEGIPGRREEFLRLVQLNGEGSWIRRSS
jgi:GTP cyclohydrolase I